MESYRVFISSIMNPAIENLAEERKAARRAVDHFAPLANSWAFEGEPASATPLLEFYIGAVKACDLFVLILGEHLTPPVQAEYETAKEHAKPVLIFCKKLDSRNENVRGLLSTCNVKYEIFGTPTDLKKRMRRAVAMHFLQIVRGGTENFRPSGLLGQLKAIADANKAVRISPLVPTVAYDSFRILSVDPDIITLRKESSHQAVTLPASRIEDILPAAPNESPILLLRGRLQWITIPEVWRFFPEAPRSDDHMGLGFPKEHPFQDPELPKALNSHGYAGRWSNAENVAKRLMEGQQPFYGEDGKYLTSNGMVFLVSRTKH
jgi:hypothetical protein